MAASDSMPFEGWAIVELMGHRRLGAYVTEVEIAGAAMLRLDVPEHPWVEGCTCGSEHPEAIDHEAHTPACHMFREEGDEKPLDVYATQFYSAAALYCLTPTTQEMARALRSKPEPIQRWELPRPALPVGAIQDAELEPDDEDDFPL